jgi:hypothetical protein
MITFQLGSICVKATDEQADAIEAFDEGDNLALVAGAGTGKTTVLKMMAEGDSRRGLYLAFNKSVREEANIKFRKTNVEARTAHSLAYKDFGAPRQDRLPGQGAAFMRNSTLAKALDIVPTTVKGDDISERKVGAAELAHLAKQTVKQFTKTKDESISLDMVELPPLFAADKKIAADLTPLVHKYAERLWKEVVSLDSEIPISHDDYLKLYQLSKPFIKADYIFLDEAQDADSLMVEIIKDQMDHAQIIAVGDRSQAIYGWRGGTIDAMTEFGGVERHLTQSFRFGDAIAAQANKILDLLDADIRLRGTPSIKSEVLFGERLEEPDAILTRTNIGSMVEVLARQSAGENVAIAGQHKANEMKKIAKAAQDLQEKGYTPHPDFSAFDNWSEVVAFSETDEGSEFTPIVNLVQTWSPLQIIDAIDSCVPVEKSDVVISTAHIAKGLEWNRVRIGEDFYPPKYIDGVQQPLAREEAMLAYVAVTRAKHELDDFGLSWIYKYRGEIE